MKIIKILGAWPSGLSAAINLAKNWYKVEIYEKNKDVGLRFKWDLQGLENWSGKDEVKDFLNSINIKINFDFDPFSELTVSDWIKKIQFKCSKPAFYLIKRGKIKGSLDNWLKKQAIDLGVKIYFEKTINKNEADIIATWPNFKEIFAIDKWIVFNTNMNDISVGLVNDSAAYKGYSYLLVTKGYWCMCSYLWDKFDRINNCFDKTKKIFNNLFEFNIENPKEVGWVGSFSLKNKFIINNSKVVWEAAGLQDILWGFWLRNALYSWFLASKAIIENKDYNLLVERYFRKKLKASLVNRYLWEKFWTNNYNNIVSKIHNSKDPLKYLYSFHNYNLIQRIFYPFALHYCRKNIKNLDYNFIFLN